MCVTIVSVQINWNSIVDSSVCLYKDNNIQYAVPHNLFQPCPYGTHTLHIIFTDNDNLLFNLISDLEFKVLWHVWRTGRYNGYQSSSSTSSSSSSVTTSFVCNANCWSGAQSERAFLIQASNVCTIHCGHCTCVRVDTCVHAFRVLLQPINVCIWSCLKYTSHISNTINSANALKIFTFDKVQMRQMHAQSPFTTATTLIFSYALSLTPSKSQARIRRFSCYSNSFVFVRTTDRETCYMHVWVP